MSKKTITYHLVSCELTKYLNQYESILLNQILYWISKCGRKIDGQEGKWIYNSLADWHKQFSYWSMYKLRKTIKSLETMGLIKSIKINAKKWNHTKWYTINYSKYKKLLQNIDTKKQNKTNKTITRENSKVDFENKTNSSTNRFVVNQQIILTKNNYTKDTKVSSSKKIKNVDQEINSKLDTLIEKTVINKLSPLKKKEIKLNKEQLEKVKEMKKVWDKVFEYSINPIKAYINKDNEKSLYSLIEEKFRGDINKWKEYAYKVNSSKFLMGEKKTKKGFKASFAWLIKEETVDKINVGEYGIGDRELDVNNVSSNVEVQKEEIINTVDKKITEYVKQKINDEKEQKELENYIKKEEYTRDSDKYGIGIYAKNIGSYSLINNPDNQRILKTIYETYIVKKYFRRSRFKIREQLKKMVNKQMKEESIVGNFKSLKNLKDNLNFHCIENDDIDLLTCS